MTARAITYLVTLLTWAPVVACDQSPSTSSSEAVRVVANALGPNELGISQAELTQRANPNGEGTFVYVPQTRFSGVERYIIWMVIDGQAYALNGATKGVTPSLPWPREAANGIWERTGIDRFAATEAIEIVFGR